MGKAGVISTKIRKKTKVSTLPTLNHCSTGILSKINKTRKRNKRVSNK
jgi:hypothetical protein